MANNWKVYNPDSELVGEGESLRIAILDAVTNAVIKGVRIEDHLFGPTVPVVMAPKIPRDPADI